LFICDHCTIYAFDLNIDYGEGCQKPFQKRARLHL